MEKQAAFSEIKREGSVSHTFEIFYFTLMIPVNDQLLPFFLDFVLVYEVLDGHDTPKYVLRHRKKYMNNLQKSQLEFEEVFIFLLSRCLTIRSSPGYMFFLWIFGMRGALAWETSKP